MRFKKKKQNNTKRNKLSSADKGFSLIEMLVAVALFSGVMLIAVGALLSLIDANRKAQALSSVMNNLNFALENMSRNIRVGTTYHCESSNNVPTDVDEVKDCSSGGQLFAFEASSGDSGDKNDQIVYRINGTKLEKSERSGLPNTFIDITAAEVSIDKFSFYVDGTSLIDGMQPRVVIVLQGSAGVNARTRTEFNLQTMVSQRVLDI
jgi:prepilin-type N-terminal cleavage/methylation domain-containing protein